jgi:hypothetical protein
LEREDVVVTGFVWLRIGTSVVNLVTARCWEVLSSSTIDSFSRRAQLHDVDVVVVNSCFI